MTRRYHAICALIVTSFLILVSGCCHGRPRLWDLRPLEVQRRQLQRFDPYPDNDIGPPMVGVRPPGFQEQLNEPTRSRWLGPITAGGILP